MSSVTGKHLHRTTLVEVDEDGPVEPAFTKGELIPPEYSWGGARGHYGAGDDPQQRTAAGAHVQAASDSGSTAPAQGKPQRRKRLGQARGTPGMHRDQIDQALGKRAPGTRGLIAEKAPYPQPELHSLITDRQVARRADIATVDARGWPLTMRTACRGAGGMGIDDQLGLHPTHGVNDKTGK
jgi:hypothetical protein